MQLTPQQRIAAYEWAAERVEKGRMYVCHLCVDYLMKTMGTWFSYNEATNLFPELNSFKQVLYPCATAWFYFSENGLRETKEARLFILGSCILMAGGEL